MNKKIKHICQDIRNEKLLEENLPQLFNHMANHYQAYATVGLAMHYFSFYEAYFDDENTWSTEAKEFMKQVNSLIGEQVLQTQSGVEREKAIKSIDSIRQNIMKRMEILTAYTDVFQTYEYILNRVEYRFKQEILPIDEEEFAKEILRYIFDSEDNLIINEKIKEIIGQLPIRITKQKYLDLLKESLHPYLGADKSSLDSYLYMLRTSSMLYLVENMDTYYPGLWEKKEHLASLEYKDISQENYEKALGMLRAAVFVLETESFVYYSLQEVVNEVYAILLCSPYSGIAETETEAAEKAALSIIKEVNTLFISEEVKELPAELIDRFADIEGVQEEKAFELSAMEEALYLADNTYSQLVKSLMLDQLLQVLLRSQKLLSNSMFINLDEEQEEDTVDEDMLSTVTKELITDVTDLFNSHDRVISRAVMANTLNKMPVFFKDHKEVMEYVRYSMERCTDSYEKAAVVEIINALMSE